MATTDYTGRYLITHKNFVFAGEPEIFLLLQDGDEVIAVCVNQIIYVENNKTSYMNYGYIRDQFKDMDTRLLPTGEHLPVLWGGVEFDEYFAIHTSINGDSESQKFLEYVYHKCDIQNLINHLNDSGKLPAYFHFFRGYQRLNPLLIAANILTGDWEIREGSFAMTYGNCVHDKFEFIDTLRKYKTIKGDKVDVVGGKMLNDIKGMMEERIPSMMAAATRTYYEKETDLEKEKIEEAVRISIALSETEGNDVTRVRRKYTLQEQMKKFDSLMEGGFKFKLLERYDRSREMLQSQLLNPAIYDSYLTAITIYPTKEHEELARQRRKEKEKAEPSARTDELTRRWRSFEKIVKKDR